MSEIVIDYGGEEDSDTIPTTPVTIVYRNVKNGTKKVFEFTPPQEYHSVVDVDEIEKVSTYKEAYSRYQKYLSMNAMQRTEYARVQGKKLLISTPIDYTSSAIASKIIAFTELLICIGLDKIGLLDRKIKIGSASTYKAYFGAYKNIVNQLAKSADFLNRSTLRLDYEKVRVLMVPTKDEVLSSNVVKIGAIDKQKLMSFNSALFLMSQTLQLEPENSWSITRAELEDMVQHILNSDEYLSAVSEPLQKKRKVQSILHQRMPRMFSTQEVQKFISTFGNYLCEYASHRISNTMRFTLLLQLLTGARVGETSSLQLGAMSTANNLLVVTLLSHKTYNVTNKEKTFVLVPDRYTSAFSYSLLLAFMILPKLKKDMTNEDMESIATWTFLNPDGKLRGEYETYLRVMEHFTRSDSSVHPTLKEYILTPHELKTHLFRKVTNAYLSERFGSTAAAKYIQWELGNNNQFRTQLKHYNTFVDPLDKKLFTDCSDILINGVIPELFGVTNPNPYLSRPVKPENLDMIVNFPRGYSETNELVRVLKFVLEAFIQHMAFSEHNERCKYVDQYVTDYRLAFSLKTAILYHCLQLIIDDQGQSEREGEREREREDR